MAHKEYKTEEETPKILNETDAVYLIDTMRKGIAFNTFSKIAEASPFDLDEWSGFLHLSERTIQRYKKEKKAFDPIHSEKILEITMLFNKGHAVFGDKTKFNTWMSSNNVALGNIKPKELLDSTFGINLLRDELTRIEHGILA